VKTGIQSSKLIDVLLVNPPDFVVVFFFGSEHGVVGVVTKSMLHAIAVFLSNGVSIEELPS
jgi:hypothetical protein